LGRTATPASDIYALGLVVYEMVTGVLPFHGSGGLPGSALMNRLKGPPPSPTNFVPELIPICEALILRCLEQDPAKRFPSGEALSAALSVASGDKAAPFSAPADSTASAVPAQLAVELPLQDIVLLYKRNSAADEQLLEILE